MRMRPLHEEPVELTCVGCGRTFEQHCDVVRKTGQKYCSEACRNDILNRRRKAERAARPDRYCVVCKRVLPMRRTSYCSDACARFGLALHNKAQTERGTPKDCSGQRNRGRWPSDAELRRQNEASARLRESEAKEEAMAASVRVGCALGWA